MSDGDDDDDGVLLLGPNSIQQDTDLRLDPGLLTFIIHELRVAGFVRTAKELLLETGMESATFIGGSLPRLKQLVDLWNTTQDYHQFINEQSILVPDSTSSSSSFAVPLTTTTTTTTAPPQPPMPPPPLPQTISTITTTTTTTEPPTAPTSASAAATAAAKAPPTPSLFVTPADFFSPPPPPPMNSNPQPSMFYPSSPPYPMPLQQPPVPSLPLLPPPKLSSASMSMLSSTSPLDIEYMVLPTAEFCPETPFPTQESDDETEHDPGPNFDETVPTTTTTTHSDEQNDDRDTSASQEMVPPPPPKRRRPPIRNDDPKQKHGPWLIEEEELLRHALTIYGEESIPSITAIVDTRSGSSTVKHLQKIKRGWGSEANQRICEGILYPQATFEKLMDLKPWDRSEKDLLSWLEWFCFLHCPPELRLPYLQPPLPNTSRTWTEQEKLTLKRLIEEMDAELLEPFALRFPDPTIVDLCEKAEQGAEVPVNNGKKKKMRKSTQGRWTSEEALAFDRVFRDTPKNFKALRACVPLRSREAVARRIRKLNGERDPRKRTNIFGTWVDVVSVEDEFSRAPAAAAAAAPAAIGNEEAPAMKRHELDLGDDELEQ